MLEDMLLHIIVLPARPGHELGGRPSSETICIDFLVLDSSLIHTGFDLIAMIAREDGARTGDLGNNGLCKKL